MRIDPLMLPSWLVRLLPFFELPRSLLMRGFPCSFVLLMLDVRIARLMGLAPVTRKLPCQAVSCMGQESVKVYSIRDGVLV